MDAGIMVKATGIGRWLHLFRLVRLPNLVLLWVAQALSYYALVRHHALPDFQPFTWFWVLAATGFAAAAGYVINDYHDIRIDRINRPNKLIIGEYVSRTEALMATFVFNAIACGLALLAGWKMLVLVLGCTVILWVYSIYLKRLPLIGNITIAALSAAAILLSGFPDNYFPPLLWGYAGFAFLSHLIRELVKDMEDIPGDIKHGCKTLPILWGIHKTKLFIVAMVTVFLGLLVMLAMRAPVALWVYLLVVPGPMMLWFLFKLWKADNIKDFHFLSALSKAIMLFGLISMLWA
jgi:4-hydroxybenzoate polyprenyltransferase